MKSIQDAYRERFHKDGILATEAATLLPDGINSDSRYMLPHPVYVTHANGSRKWGLNGQEFIDYWCGHGALLFGHNPPAIVSSVTKQIQKGTHFGACHPLEIEWAKLIPAFIPSAERIRFTNSGTEANQQAVRLSRAFTGKNKVLLFEGHYHGWLYPIYPTHAIKDNMREIDNRIICPPNDIELVEHYLSNDPNIACIILEPTGPCSGVVPLDGEFLKQLRIITEKYDVVLIFDEVITGFRVTDGSCQAFYNIKPDLTTLGKILTGGLPGGAIVGRKEIMNLISNDEKLRGSNQKKIAHYGTFSANPLSASSGIAMLNLIKQKNPYPHINDIAQKLRDGLNNLFTQHQLDWVVYGQFSCIKFLIGHGVHDLPASAFSAQQFDYKKLLKRGDKDLAHLLRKTLLLQGVDISLSSVISVAHNEADITKTISAFDAAIHRIKKEGQISYLSL